MAKADILVTTIAFLGFLVNLINNVAFILEIVFWFGLIWNSIGLVASIILFVKAGCIQGIWYYERYRSEDKINIKGAVIELEDKQTPRTPDTENQPGTALQMETQMTTEIIESNKITVVKNDIQLMDNFQRTINEFRNNKVYLVLFIGYFILDFALAVKLIQSVAVYSRQKASFAYGVYPSKCTTAFDTNCIRTDLKVSECQGTQNYKKPIVFEGSLSQMGLTLAQCLEKTTIGFNFGVESFEPVNDVCDFTTSRPFNQRLTSTYFTKYQQLQCFQFAHVVIADSYFAMHNDLYINASSLKDQDRVYLQMMIWSRNGRSSISYTQQLIDDMYNCVSQQMQPASKDPVSYTACSNTL